ncbi:hypothetical protein AB0I98_37730 [Streptomyces sp. NPDC050211]|uniref:hypothetical protein n=1 Tax=Streptomyces sp. NPDC050211 TaxID=3154932 RepID=UPI003442BC0D
MIQQVSHTVTGADPAGFALAVEVAYELHAPVPRAPEVAASGGARTRRTASASRTRRRTALG